MDAQRSRRTKDQARKTWYAYYRQVRFARWFGFIELDEEGMPIYRCPVPQAGAVLEPLRSCPARPSCQEKPVARFPATGHSVH